MSSAGPFTPRPGTHLTPAQTVPRPGIYSGPSAVAGHETWLWIAVLAVVLVVATFLVRRRR